MNSPIIGQILLFARNAFANALTSSMGLLLAVAGIRFLSPTDFGEMRFVLTLLSLLMIFSLPGYDNVILRNLNFHTSINLRRIFLVRTILATAGGVILLCFIWLMKTKLNATLRFFLTSIAFLLPFFETTTGFKNYLFGCGLHKAAVNLFTLTRMCSIILFVTLCSVAQFLGWSMLLILPFYMISLSVPSIFFFSRIARPNAHASENSLCLDQAIKVTYAGAIYSIVFALDKIGARYFWGPEQLAADTILLMVPQEIARAFDAFTPILYRKLFLNNATSAQACLLRFSPILFAIAAIYVALFYSLQGIILGPKYHFTLMQIIVSGLMIISLTIELVQLQNIFALHSSNGLCKYSTLNLCITSFLVLGTLWAFGIMSLMVAQIIKQLFIGNIFLRLHSWLSCRSCTSR